MQGGKTVRYDGTFEDITERKLLEDQLRQAQKMEAIGQLAGGVAHDFNNAIGVIVGYSALLKDGLSSNETLNRYADEIDKAGHRAASLTRQLLAFSRKQVIQPTVVDLNALVGETEKMLRRLIGEDIELVLVRMPGLGRTRLDVGQVDQILMNLAVNARDAMTNGGKLVIELSNAELDETNLARRSYAKPGSYVMLSVSDTGCGMDKETQNHIFEPFFTTKGPGQGTGLGLSTVYGIVKQSEGYIWVYSEPGKGTTFKIYFPRIEAAAEPIKRVDTSEIPRGSETILVVEDDEAMRALTRTCLESGGYSVLDVSNGEAAIRAVTENGGAIHLMVTDVIMPGISGRHLAESVLLVGPKMKILYISGYTADLIARQGILEKQVALLEKPFTKGALLRKVREILDGEQLAKSATATQPI
jgi:nitrogen-specific signal transduction histidine kinase/ActR/RegA family two-component response regulator